MSAKANPSINQSSFFDAPIANSPTDDDPFAAYDEAPLAGPELSADADQPTRQLSVVMYCDGGSRGNPGPAAIGAVVFDANADDAVVLAEVSECIGIATNNVAEYKAMLAGLDAAFNIGATTITVRADSKLLIEQLKGNYKVKHPNLQPLHAAGLNKLKRFQRVTLEHVRREYNTEADALVNQALDAARKR